MLRQWVNLMTRSLWMHVKFYLCGCGLRPMLSVNVEIIKMHPCHPWLSLLDHGYQVTMKPWIRMNKCSNHLSCISELDFSVPGNVLLDSTLNESWLLVSHFLSGVGGYYTHFPINQLLTEWAYDLFSVNVPSVNAVIYQQHATHFYWFFIFIQCESTSHNNPSTCNLYTLDFSHLRLPWTEDRRKGWRYSCYWGSICKWFIQSTLSIKFHCHWICWENLIAYTRLSDTGLHLHQYTGSNIVHVIIIHKSRLKTC